MRVMDLICGTQEQGDEVRPAVNLIERTNGDDDKVSSWRHISSHVTETSYRSDMIEHFRFWVQLN
jgi:hypothetical protein